MKTCCTGCDTGINNFAVVDVVDDAITFARLVRNPIRDLKHGDDGYVAQLRAYCREWRKLHKRLNNKMYAMERFQTRGQGGHTIERIGVMIGVLSKLVYPTPTTLIIASEWKNLYRREKGDNALDRFYAAAKKKKVPPHFIDAYLIARYSWWKAHGKKGKAFSGFSVKAIVLRLSKLLAKQAKKRAKR